VTKQDWLIKWREYRVEQKILREAATFPTAGEFFICLREVYGYSYLPKQEITMHLVNKYKDKLSPNYLKEHFRLVESWKLDAEKRAHELMKSLLFGPNLFLALRNKETYFTGSYFPVPIKYTPSS